MAAVSILPQPVDLLAMTSRREPLANVPNAANSPFRNHIPTANGKRTRAQAGDPRTAIPGQPPTKKQVIELPHDDVENVDPKKREFVAVGSREKLEEPFMKRAPNAVPNAFERKLASVREKKPSSHRADQSHKDNLETVRQWKRHYLKQFPCFVFYFEGLSDDARNLPTRQIQGLGAKIEKFFSNKVTHIVTTRPIPIGLATTSPDEDVKYDNVVHKSLQPSMLGHEQRRTTNLLDASLQRRAQGHVATASHDVDPRRATSSGADILSRAQDLGIKIWQLEKLQRIMKTMYESDTADLSTTHDVRSHATVHKTAAKPAKDADLEQLLRNEKINGPTDRDMTVTAQDSATFKGFYIYIHDMDEKTKPVMVRDYPKPEIKEHGKWPQFRLTSAGRCPFVEDPAHTRKLQQEQEQQEQLAKAEQDLALQRRTRAGSASLELQQAPTERNVNLRRSPRKSAHPPAAEMAKPLDPPKNVPSRRQSSAEGPPLFNSAQQSLRGLPRMVGGEPMASGLQQSTITSAIRSQAISSVGISSTAAGMNRRVNDTKEVSALKRKVLERGANTTSAHSNMPSSYMNDVRAAINDDARNQPPPRAAKRKAQETLGIVYEDHEDHDGTQVARRKAPIQKRRKPAAKEAKPGYCENCRDKFEDFDEHVLSRKHRKFAMTQENWSELDALLVQLKRPHKVVQ